MPLAARTMTLSVPTTDGVHTINPLPASMLIPLGASSSEKDAAGSASASTSYSYPALMTAAVTGVDVMTGALSSLSWTDTETSRVPSDAPDTVTTAASSLPSA